MKNQIIILVVTVALAACSRDKGITVKNSDTANATGGVDVGNMQSAAVPKTYASISYPSSWTSTASTDVLSIQNRSGSLISAQKSEITDISSPNAVSLQQYLKAKHPDRDYQIINFNGLDGVRADLVSNETEKHSDNYLVSELKDFIHIQSNLKKIDDGIATGEQIILTVRVEYKGAPYPNSQPKTVTMPSYNVQTSDYKKAAYSIHNDCYPYVDSGCRGVSILFANGGGTRLDIGTAGYQHGRIIELGPESQAPFDSIKVEGKFLVGPLTKVALSDIYTTFLPKNPQVEQGAADLKEGHVYLVRTVNWPEEDLISKIRVDRVEAGKSLTLTYAKLVYVDPKDLQKQVDIINKNTLDNEKPLLTGEVTLFSSSFWKSYYHASFNFEYSTSGNMFITYNGWDLLFGSGSSQPTFLVPYAGSSFGQVIDVGQKNLNEISLGDFPDPNTFKPNVAPLVKAGHTYIIYHYSYDGKVTYGAVQVLELGPQDKWVRLKFRRVAIKTVNYFQNWIELNVPQGNQSVFLEQDQNYSKSVYYPFTNKRGDQGSHYHENMNFSADGDYLSVDSRPYGNKRGFYKLPKNTLIDSVTQTQIEALRGKFDRDVHFQKGDVIAVLLENYFDKTVMVIKVENHIPGKSVQLSVKFIYRAKTVYSNDRD